MVLVETPEERLLSAEELYKSGQMPDMMKHWYSIRKQYPENFLLAYRMGDFYEFFYDDAVKVSKLLGLTLTRRNSGTSRHPLAGIPHKATQHFKTLVKHGQTVIIVEQLEDPKKAEGKIVKRGVVRILSPGTVVDDELLESGSANFICGIYREKKNFGVAFLDISSADFLVTEFFGKNALANLWSYLARYSPVECVLPQELTTDYTFMNQFRENASVIIKEHPQFHFLFNNASETLTKSLKVENLHGFAIDEHPLAISAAGGLISFFQETQKQENLENITHIRYIRDDEYMFLDLNTQRNLELLRNQNDGGTYGTLFDIMDQTKTPMGTRLLKNWIVQPLLSKDDIDERLDLVQFFVEHYDLRYEIRNLLGQVGDLARLISRINFSSTVNARNILQIKMGLEVVRKIREIFSSTTHPILTKYLTQLQDLEPCVDLIEKAIHESPPTTITEGEIIKEGYNSQVDEYRDILHNGKSWILKVEEEEKKRLGIGAGLKITYNRVLGYFIQITVNALKGVTIPDDYIQRQTLKGAYRYETARLKEMETKILSAEENVMDLEYQLFQEIREQVQTYTPAIQRNAEIIAILDVISCFADIAQNYNYTRPTISTHTRLIIKQGRHPVVEQINRKEAFVPNDNLMDTDTEQLLVITGPNWSGKSTYLRQVALIALMGQMGCFVPAESADIGIVDRIFTRIGASDDLSRGQSTFMLEMNEMAQILNYMTEKSMIIIDELGRGTGTIDGQSIAQAVIEYLHDFGVKTLFSTHFHELINLQMPRLHNYHFKIIEKPETRKLIFLRQLTDGGTDKSYGIHVAMMAGLPSRVTDRAFDLMELGLACQSGITSSPQTPGQSASPSSAASASASPMNVNNSRSSGNSLPSKTVSPAKKKRKTLQTSLFPIQRYDDSELVIALRTVDLENITPLQAFELLSKLKKKVNS